VGKSTVAVNLAAALQREGMRVGLLDVDIHGPTVPTMLQLGDTLAETQGNEVCPVEVGGLKVMSIGFLLADPTDAVIWRGPRKAGMIKAFLQDVDWGELDYLIVDAPPGTGDEPLSVCQLMEGADGAVVVTTPQEVALTAVRKSITFCRKMDMPVLGVVENMSGFACPHCGEVTDIFQSGGGAKMALTMGVPFLGRIPIDANVGASGDSGSPFVDEGAATAVSRAFEQVVDPILALSGTSDGPRDD
jgi:Mrp family chromosome partitioning ATPase